MLRRAARGRSEGEAAVAESEPGGAQRAAADRPKAVAASIQMRRTGAVMMLGLAAGGMLYAGAPIEQMKKQTVLPLSTGEDAEGHCHQQRVAGCWWMRLTW